MKISYLLEKRTDKNGDAPIRASISEKGIQWVTSVGYSINPSLWDSLRQRVKDGCSNSKGDSYNTINGRLADIEKAVSDLSKRCAKTETIITKELIKANIVVSKNPRTKQEKPKEVTLFDHYDEFMKDEDHKSWSKATIAKFKVVKSHLINYNPKLRYEDLTKDGLNKYVDFLLDEDEGENLVNSTVKKQISFLKMFLRWAEEKGYNKTTDYSRFTLKRLSKVTGKKHIVFLSWDELLSMYNFDIPESKNYLDRVRDVFCFCAFTSLRYSDAYNLRREDIHDDALDVTTKKTKDRVTIELNKYSRAILAKYESYHFAEDKALPVISNQRMNDYLKELGKLCGFTKKEKIITCKGSETLTEYIPKYELIGTHTARRTFISNAIMKGIAPDVIMEWTGHSDYDAMKPYIGISDESKKSAMRLFDD